MTKPRERRAAAIKKILDYLLKHEGRPPAYFTTAELAYAASESMSFVGTIIGQLFGVALRRGYGYSSADIYRRLNEMYEMEEANGTAALAISTGGVGKP